MLLSTGIYPEGAISARMACAQAFPFCFEQNKAWKVQLKVRKEAGSQASSEELGAQWDLSGGTGLVPSSAVPPRGADPVAERPAAHPAGAQGWGL